MGNSFRPPTRPTRPTRFVRLRNLACFPEVHSRLLGGMPLVEIARFIQEDAQEYRDISRSHLEDLLSDFRGEMPKTELLSVRMPEAMVKAKEALDQGVNELAELGTLYRLQHERILLDVAHEKKIGKMFKTTGPEIFIAMRILKNMAQLKMDLGIDQRHLGKLEVKEDRTETKTIRAELVARYGKDEIAKVMSDPTSRRKVLMLAERVMKVGKDTADEIRAEVSGADADADDAIDVTPEKVLVPVKKGA